MNSARRSEPSAHSNLHIQWTDDGSRTLIDPATEVAYHSGCGALAETRKVYLENSGIAKRLNSRQASSVLEIGLGTGLGFLLTADCAIQHAVGLQYVAIERDWVGHEMIKSLNYGELLKTDSLFKEFCDWRQKIVKAENASHQASFKNEVNDQLVNLCVEVADAESTMDRWTTCLTAVAGYPFDAVYFDPFDPHHNPDSWTTTMLSLARRMLKPSGRLVTYCVNRKIRDRFASVGFQVYRVPGPEGGKREVLVATPADHGERQNSGNQNSGNRTDRLSTQQLRDLP